MDASADGVSGAALFGDALFDSSAARATAFTSAAA